MRLINRMLCVENSETFGYRFFRCVMFCALALLSSSVSAETLSIPITDDTFIQTGSDNAVSNFSDSVILRFARRSDNDAATREIYMKLDLSSLADLSGEIESARIMLSRDLTLNPTFNVVVLAETLDDNGFDYTKLTAGNLAETFPGKTLPSVVLTNETTGGNAALFAVQTLTGRRDVNSGATRFSLDMTARLRELVAAGKKSVVVHLYEPFYYGTMYSNFIASRHTSVAARPMLEVVVRNYPPNLSASIPADGGAAEVTWDAYKNATDYTVECAENPAGEWTVLDAAVAGTTWSDNTVTDVRIPRFYRVRANGVGEVSPAVRLFCVRRLISLKDTYFQYGKPSYESATELQVKCAYSSSTDLNNANARESFLSFGTEGLLFAKDVRLSLTLTSGAVPNAGQPELENVSTWANLFGIRTFTEDWEENWLQQDFRTNITSVPVPLRSVRNVQPTTIGTFMTSLPAHRSVSLDVSDVVRSAGGADLNLSLYGEVNPASLLGGLFRFASREHPEVAARPTLIATAVPFGYRGLSSSFVRAEGGVSVTLSWEGQFDAASYNVYRVVGRRTARPVFAANVTACTFSETIVLDGAPCFYCIRPVTASGEEGPASDLCDVGVEGLAIIEAAKDTFIYQSEVDSVHGAEEWLIVRKYTNFTRETLLSFDVPSLLNVTSAVLRLTKDGEYQNVVPTGPMRFQVEALTPFDWDETTFNWSLAKAAGLTLPSSAVRGTPLGVITRPVDASTGDVYEIDVTSLLRQIRSPSGEVLIHIFGIDNGFLLFNSKEVADLSLRPCLVLRKNMSAKGTLLYFR